MHPTRPSGHINADPPRVNQESKPTRSIRSLGRPQYTCKISQCCLSPQASCSLSRYRGRTRPIPVSLQDLAVFLGARRRFPRSLLRYTDFNSEANAGWGEELQFTCPEAARNIVARPLQPIQLSSQHNVELGRLGCGRKQVPGSLSRLDK